MREPGLRDTGLREAGHRIPSPAAAFFLLLEEERLPGHHVLEIDSVSISHLVEQPLHSALT